MFVQVITLKAPQDHNKELRQLVADEYLPAIRNRPGFVSANLLEQVDDPDTAQLIVYWDSQRSVENTHRTGVLTGTTQSIAARLPGLRVQRQSYIARVTIDNKATEVQV